MYSYSLCIDFYTNMNNERAMQTVFLDVTEIRLWIVYNSYLLSYIGSTLAVSIISLSINISKTWTIYIDI